MTNHSKKEIYITLLLLFIYMKRYTKEQLIFYLQKLAKKLKATPTTKEMDSYKKFPSSGTYYVRFGSWNKALKKAGLKLNIKTKYTKEELKENLRLLTKELGRVPKSSDLKNKKWAASYATYRKYFGSWKKALRAAKLNQLSFINLKSFSK